MLIRAIHLNEGFQDFYSTNIKIFSEHFYHQLENPGCLDKIVKLNIVDLLNDMTEVKLSYDKHFRIEGTTICLQEAQNIFWCWLFVFLLSFPLVTSQFS